MQLTSFNALLYLGDYDYECNPNNYFTDVLDSNRKYQFMGVLGNHETANECGEEVAKKFKTNVINEMTSSRNNNVNCEYSSSKYMWSCKYNNLRVIGLNPAIEGADSRSEQLSFLKKHLGEAKEDWKICSWHFYDMGYHTGKYSDEENGNIVSRDGESFYDYCREQGAIIFSAHDHVYARTHVMSNFKNRVIDEKDKNSDGKNVEIRKGATINILNGVGGWEIYDEKGEQANYSHWQKKYARGTSAENANKYGGVFCDFNYGGNSKKAYCQMLRINSDSKVFDSFYINRA
ncbi:hypothetical protein BCR36DRAFT_341013 [Piromyces finnis]|uniref:Calcineurin-like phosphoesterase domain-containing protein n=1 Tax=Piromyces finnis TaxID=1754191 RepID=A0A1Y1VNH0_9FUNG|nr:hypothetical protein BCR36DRAFT_341013 [Piromyces finnis]|eukprot:ORX60954.1 hypothetical protein BCR36DRAFT_341013 [Piromyces finnis]